MVWCSAVARWHCTVRLPRAAGSRQKAGITKPNSHKLFLENKVSEKYEGDPFQLFQTLQSLCILRKYVRIHAMVTC